MPFHNRTVLSPPLWIISSGDEEDRKLALQIVRQTEGFADVEILDVDEFAGRLRSSGQALGRVLTVTVLIVSPSLAADPKRCEIVVNLLRLCYKRGLAFLRHYCICQGMTPLDAERDVFLSGLVEDVMILDREQLPSLVDELREYATRILPNDPQNNAIDQLIEDAAIVLAGIMALLQRLFGWVYKFTWLCLVMLAVLLWRGVFPAWTKNLVVLCAFFAGVRLNGLQPTDLWPFLGRFWKLPRMARDQSRGSPFRVTDLFPIGLVSTLGMGVAFVMRDASDWLLQASVIVTSLNTQIYLDQRFRRRKRGRSAYAEAAARALKETGLGGSGVSAREFGERIGGALGIIYGFDILAVSSVAAQICVSVIVARHTGVPTSAWILGAFLAGFVVAAALDGHLAIEENWRGGGLTEAAARRWSLMTIPSFRRPPFGSGVIKEDLEHFSLDERAQVVYWLVLVKGLASNGSYRRWRARKDSVFISYLWRDHTEGKLPSLVANACAGIGVEYFLDRRNNPEGKANFRSQLARSLGTCTHFLLLFSPQIASGRVVMREIEMAMQRRALEMLPAIICVVEPEVAERLRTDITVPLVLRFVLTFCTQMTPLEAARPELVRYVIELTRREGKLHDWGVLLSPLTAVDQVIRLPGTVDSPNGGGTGRGHPGEGRAVPLEES